MGQDLRRTGRAGEVLHLIVQAYIQTGEPVSSQAIARRFKQSLSAATIRNVMAELLEEGYLSQPHTSAGRIPTGKAFRSYVQSIARARVTLPELDRMRMELSHVHTVEGMVEQSSHMLTELTHGVGIAAAIPTVSQTLQHVELTALADHRVLMTVVTGDRMVRNRVVDIDGAVSQAELSSIRDYLNTRFSGWALRDVRNELSRCLHEERAAYDSVLRKLTVLYAKGLLDVGLVAEVHLEGASNLLGLDLRLTREKMRELFKALEEKHRILQLLDQFLAQPAGELAVQVGLAEVHPSMNELCLIGLSVPLAEGLWAKIAVIGPMRMNYHKAISAVSHMGRAFQRIPA